MKTNLAPKFKQAPKPELKPETGKTELDSEKNQNQNQIYI